MAWILYDNGLVNRPVITITDGNGQAIDAIAGDINRLDAGPLVVSLADADSGLRLEFTSTGTGNDPTAVAVDLSIGMQAGVTSAVASATLSVLSGAATGAGSLLAEQRVARGQRGTFPAVLATAGSISSYRLAIGVDIAPTAAVVKIHAVHFLRKWQLPQAVDANWSQRFVDLSEVQRADSGRARVQLRRRLRQITVNFSNRRQSQDVLPEVSGGLLRIMQAVGRSRPIMLIPRELSEAIDPEIAVLGLLQNDPELEHVRASRYTLPGISILEL